MSVEHLSYPDLARRLGVSVAAAKARARRAGWQRQRWNDGVVRVATPADAVPAEKGQETLGSVSSVPENAALLEALRLLEAERVRCAELADRVATAELHAATLQLRSEAAEARAVAAERRADCADAELRAQLREATPGSFLGRLFRR